MTQPVDQTPEERARELAGSHYSCDDPWYSCPLSVDGCVDERQEGCTCGYNQRVARIASALADERRRALEESAALIDKRLKHYNATKGVDAFTRAIQINEATGCAEAIRAQAQEVG